MDGKTGWIPAGRHLIVFSCIARVLRVRKCFSFILADPFFKSTDDGVWSIPKGLADDGEVGEQLLEVAKREFEPLPLWRALHRETRNREWLLGLRLIARGLMCPSRIDNLIALIAPRMGRTSSTNLHGFRQRRYDRRLVRRQRLSAQSFTIIKTTRYASSIQSD